MSRFPKQVAVLIVLLGLVTGCRHQAAQTPEKALSGSQKCSTPQPAQDTQAPLNGITPALDLKGLTPAAALHQPFDAPYQVTLTDVQHTSKALNTCADFLEAEGSIYSAGSDQDYRALLREGARCDALLLLSHARPAPNGAFANFSFPSLRSADLPPQVDLLIANESFTEAKRIAAHGGSDLAIEPSLRLHNTGPYQSDLDAKDWSGTLTDYGHADLYGDGKEELLLLRTAQAKGGTYAATDLFVLEAKGKGPMRVVDQRPHLGNPPR